MELEYKFWESKEDKELRIKQLWIDLNKKKALMKDSDQKKVTDE